MPPTCHTHIGWTREASVTPTAWPTGHDTWQVPARRQSQKRPSDPKLEDPQAGSEAEGWASLPSPCLELQDRRSPRVGLTLPPILTPADTWPQGPGQPSAGAFLPGLSCCAFELTLG